MIKKYVMIVSAILVIFMFTSTSSASFLFSKGKIYEMLSENSPLKNILNRLNRVVYNSDDASLDEEDDETNDEDDGEYDDGMHDEEIEPDGPDKKGEDNLLPKVLEEGFYWTPDDGNEIVVEENTLEETSTIDVDGKEETTLEDKPTVDETGKEDTTLERVIEIIKENNRKIGDMLQRVVEHTYAPGTTSGGTSENIVENVVVAGETIGISKSIKEDVVVVTDNNQ